MHFSCGPHVMPGWWELFREFVNRYDDEVEVDLQVANYVMRV